MHDPEYMMLNDAVANAFLEEIPSFMMAQDSTVSDEDIRSVVLAAHAEMSQWKMLAAREQRRTPLEIIREALAPFLAEEALPMTSRDLGEGAWRIHVAWGIARAETIAGVVPADGPPPSPAGAIVAIVSTNLMDRTRIEEAVRDQGAVPIVWRNPGAVTEGLTAVRPAVALVDLEHASAHDIIRSLVADGVRSVAYGPHVDDHAQAAARALGAAEVLPRSQFFRRLDALIPKLA